METLIGIAGAWALLNVAFVAFVALRPHHTSTGRAPLFLIRGGAGDRQPQSEPAHQRRTASRR
jgi:hypothetical protein